ncbi:MAG: sugar transferase [Pseudomonadota bacterium]|nr:sugar transferase [Pseudomonadota bacterium]
MRRVNRSRLLKRGFDVAGAVVGLSLMALPMVLIALAIWTTMGKPILFRQERPGLHGLAFRIIKFRTMRAPAGTDDDSDEVRLTGMGRFLRSVSLDELPELWNVLKGDLSLVGPRPLLMQYWDLYTPEQARRHAVKPGLTGWAQINGRNALSWQERLEMDVWYVDHQSLWLDLKILCLTLRTIARREGIHAEGHATMPRFRGNDDPA